MAEEHNEWELRLICDRIEEGFAVLLADDGRSFDVLSERLAALSGTSPTEGACYFCAVSHEGEILRAKPAVNERAGENARRLSALFKKKDLR